MTQAPDRAELLALVRSSPTLVAAHDKVGWIGIFAESYVVEDPVGSRPVRSDDPGALSRFWDAFIAPNDIVFEVYQDWVDGFDVVRDVTVVTTLSIGVVVRTPAILIYQTAIVDGTLKVRRMAAHWESVPVFAQLMRPSRAHISAALSQNRHMFRTLGAGPTWEFIGAIRTIGRRGKRLVVSELDRMGVTSLSKVIASGRTVSAAGTRDGQRVAVITEFAERSRTLLDLKIYSDPD